MISLDELEEITYSRFGFACPSAFCMETETVKLLKALPNMLRKVMPTVVNKGKKDL